MVEVDEDVDAEEVDDRVGADPTTNERTIETPMALATVAATVVATVLATMAPPMESPAQELPTLQQTVKSQPVCLV